MGPKQQILGQSTKDVRAEQNTVMGHVYIVLSSNSVFVVQCY